MDICPSYIHLRPVTTQEKAASDANNFRPDEYNLLDDEKTANIKTIRAHTPYPVSIRLFVCQNRKSHAKNYCVDLFVADTKKRLCESNATHYIFFYVDKSKQEHSENKLKEPVYFVIFARNPFGNSEIEAITAEVKKTAQWLGITGNIIQCYVIYCSASHQTLPFDIGVLTKKFTEKCPDQNYFFQFKPPIPNDGKTRYLYISGGYPRFEIRVQI